jgi:membrane-associated phospholipid phosphatase
MSRVFALVVSAVAAFGAWLTWRTFVSTRTGQLVEAAALEGAEYGQTRLWEIAEPVLEVVSLSFVVVGAAVAVIIALLQRRFAGAVQAVALVIGANLATQVLKRGFFDRPDLGGDVGANTLPSGHTTVAASFAAALVLVAPRALRPWLAILGAGYTAATGVSTLIGQWHRPSDAISAVLVVLAWSCLVCALGPTWRRDPARPVRAVGTAPAAAVLLTGGLLTGFPAGIGLADAYQAARAGEELRDVATYVGGAFGVAAVSAVAFMLLLLVLHSGPRPADDQRLDARPA